MNNTQNNQIINIKHLKLFLLLELFITMVSYTNSSYFALSLFLFVALVICIMFSINIFLSQYFVYLLLFINATIHPLFISIFSFFNLGLSDVTHEIFHYIFIIVFLSVIKIINTWKKRILLSIIALAVSSVFMLLNGYMAAIHELFTVIVLIASSLYVIFKFRKINLRYLVVLCIPVSFLLNQIGFIFDFSLLIHFILMQTSILITSFFCLRCFKDNDYINNTRIMNIYLIFMICYSGFFDMTLPSRFTNLKDYLFYLFQFIFVCLTFTKNKRVNLIWQILAMSVFLVFIFIFLFYLKIVSIEPTITCGIQLVIAGFVFFNYRYRLKKIRRHDVPPQTNDQGETNNE